MPYYYKLVDDIERVQLLSWLILSNKLQNHGTQFVTFADADYRITHLQTYSGHPDPTVERIVDKTEK